MSNFLINSYTSSATATCSQTATDETQTLGQSAGAGRLAVGNRCITGYACIGETIGSVIFNLKWSGSGTSSNTIYCRVFDSSNVLKVTMGSITLGNVPTTIGNVTFDSPDGSYDLAVNDRIVIEYDYSGSDLSYSKENSSVTGLDLAIISDGGTTYEYVTTACAYMILSA
jgi:hypothetical protein|tara:strand:+ start:529 stop:1038 length:510 start_codon:yes stop_codon:yes gene_type:complete